MGRHLVKLKPVGDVAQHRMDENIALLAEMQESLAQTGRDLETILTSQGYQDLTGQIIQKVVSFQNDLESKLVGLVSTFGIEVIPGKKHKEELYGPAHENWRVRCTLRTMSTHSRKLRLLACPISKSRVVDP
ncbi:MAG: protein phosphatase CheZ [Desulfobacterales bacterium]|nr:protein phosphatase CheZ [Desulfobacterales bacterium]